MSLDETGPDDARLIAFLDGALSGKERALVERRLGREPALKARLEALAAGSRPFRESFEALSAHAPTDRLETMLANAMKDTPSAAANQDVPPGRRWRMPRGLIAAGLALFLLGVGAGQYLPAGLLSFGAGHKSGQEDPDAWRSAVAQYWSLTTSQTLDAMPHDAATTARDLRVATARIGFPLTPEKVALPAQELERVELYHYDDAPLVEIAYLDELTGPLAFCIFANKPGAVAAPRLEQRRGFNVVYWSDADRSYMLIGQGPDEIMQKIAAILQKQVSA